MGWTFFWRKICFYTSTLIQAKSMQNKDPISNINYLEPKTWKNCVEDSRHLNCNLWKKALFFLCLAVCVAFICTELFVESLALLGLMSQFRLGWAPGKREILCLVDCSGVSSDNAGQTSLIIFKATDFTYLLMKINLVAKLNRNHYSTLRWKTKQTWIAHLIR